MHIIVPVGVTAYLCVHTLVPITCLYEYSTRLVHNPHCVLMRCINGKGRALRRATNKIVSSFHANRIVSIKVLHMSRHVILRLFFWFKKQFDFLCFQSISSSNTVISSIILKWITFFSYHIDWEIHLLNWIEQNFPLINM